jgi:hypothetical protein
MLSAFDFATPHGKENRYSFGMDRQKVAAALGQLAQDISEGKVLLLEGTVTTKAMVDGWVKTILSLELTETLPPQP